MNDKRESGQVQRRHEDPFRQREVRRGKQKRVGAIPWITPTRSFIDSDLARCFPENPFIFGRPRVLEKDYFACLR